ncbi:MAG: hypothetical protein ACOX18_07135 [Bacillota bacterium]|jgi:hypothetical protein
MKRWQGILLSLLLFLAMIALSRFLSGGRFTFGLFVFPLAIIPLLFGRGRDQE